MYLYTNVSSSVTHSSQKMESPTKLKNLKNSVLHSEICISWMNYKKERNFDICYNMSPENIMISEISQTQKDKYHMILIMSGI